MGYFRAIIKADELSQRAYDLTTKVIEENPGDYHAWQHRRKCIDASKIPLEKEMEFLTSVGIQFEKNFQIWHHRRCIMEIHQKDFDKEKEFLKTIYESDPKNYHA